MAINWKQKITKISKVPEAVSPEEIEESMVGIICGKNRQEVKEREL